MPDAPAPADVNTIAAFLAAEDVADLRHAEPVDCLVFCVSAVLHSADVLFSALEARPDLTKTLVICGGIGHSTPYLYDAISRHARYQEIYPAMSGLPEARVLMAVFDRFYDSAAVRRAGVTVLVEDRSTNCGANATETRDLLARHHIQTPRTLLVVQDPTMVRRTVASFQKAYEHAGGAPRILGCPTFVPQTQRAGADIAYCTPQVDPAALWQLPRFLDLLLGEVPRLRDDGGGYGPAGKGFIVHVDVPAAVEQAWARVCERVARGR
ncbi:hypothetical protein BKCO1_16000142 [Neofusicoccum parvum]|uniref:Putative duf218 domain protein n=1 Tax=Botryosphaeria parva (strain UCR-NP2) TaxID=1287680 RepID=R1EYF3_BOTPV|nr:putative duf218 domain protein [Neofusicoccum parvum UCRNP2]GME43095.1 hypothetical protein BKCO1_16000142 [Neofusicoccum parvum]